MSFSTQAKSRLIELSRDLLTASYVGLGRDERDVAVVRSAHSLSHSAGLTYFEFDVIHVGHSGRFGVGVGLCDLALSRLPGAERSSWAAHVDNGDLWSLHHHDNRPGGSPVHAVPPVRAAAPLRDGDAIGVIVSFCDFRIWFTLNGLVLGGSADADNAFALSLADCPGPFHAVLGMHSRGSELTARFSPPFRFDFDGLLDRTRRRFVATHIDRLPDPSPAFLGSLVVEQLAAGGFADALDAGTHSLVAGVAPLPPPSAASSVRLAERQLLRRALLDGRADAALPLLAACRAPDSLRFDVGCVAVMQLVMRGASPSDVVAFASEHVAPLAAAEPSGTAEHRRRRLMLERAIGLLAFPSDAGARHAAAAELGGLLPLPELVARANKALLPLAYDRAVVPSAAAASAAAVDDETVDDALVSNAQALLPHIGAARVPTSALELALRHRDALLAVLAANGSAEAALLLSQ